MTTLKHSDFADAFSAKVRRSLLKAGIRVIGITAIPVDGSFLNSRRGYELDMNGMYCVRNYFEVEALAGENVPARLLA